MTRCFISSCTKSLISSFYVYDIPISSFAKKTPMTTVANSGAELPAAIKVAPATSGDILSSKKIVDNALLKIRIVSYSTFTYSIQGGNKIFITYNCQTQEHINSNNDVNDKSSVGSSSLAH